MGVMIDITAPAHPQDQPESLGDHHGWPVYAMPVFVTIQTPDIERRAAWFRDALGFGVMYTAPDGGDGTAMVHVRRSRYQDVLIVRSSGRSARPDPSLRVTFQVSTDIEVDELAVRAAEHGDIEGPYDTPWNTRDVVVTDPDGHRLVFTGRRTDIPLPDLEGVMGETL